MNAEQFELFQEILEVNKQVLQKVSSIEKSLKTLTSDEEVLDPRYERSLADYPNFDWKSIGAEVLDLDKMGVRSVGYKNKIYWRTFSGYKSIEPIIFSRNEVGERQTLITFKVV